MRLLALAGDIDALIAEIRLRAPLSALAERTGWPVTWRSFHDCSCADIEAAEVAIVQRATTRRAWRLQQALRARGAAVIYDIDDLLTALPPHISNQAKVQAQQKQLRRCLQAADLVTVSTERLGRELALPATAIVPNYAWSLGDLPLPEPEPGRPVSLLFASMERLAAGFILPALRAVQGPQVQLVAVGPAGEALAAAGLDLRRQPLLPRARFIEFARALPNPVAVIPLEDSRFAACKSAIKWFEYAEAGIPVLCSNVSPYREVVADGVTGGLVANDAMAWEVALRAAVADAAWRRRIAEAARAVVRERHALDATVMAWQHAIEEALRRRAASGPWVPSIGWRAERAIAAVFEGAVLRLRRFNRDRLARRR